MTLTADKIDVAALVQPDRIHGRLYYDPEIFALEQRRVVSNIEAAQISDTETEVASNFVLVEARDATQVTWRGRSIDRLCHVDGALKISFKKVLLVNRAQPMPILQFLI